MKTKERIKELGEVFTPPSLVAEMLDKIPQAELVNPSKTIGDISGCGNGNFLIEILNRRLAAGVSHLDALKTIFGVDIMADNIKECKERLALDSTDADIWTVLNHNIICADALDSTHKGWEDVGYMWARFKEWQTIDGVLQPKQKASVLSNIRKRFHYD
jgi:type I restriction-modification system DNA methylase subunit